MTLVSVRDIVHDVDAAIPFYAALGFAGALFPIGTPR